MLAAECTFPSVRALRACVRYLCFQGDALKVVVVSRSDAPEVRLTRSAIPQHSYSEIIMKAPEALAVSKTSFEGTFEEDEFSWVVDSQLLLRTLRLFEGWESLTMELASDLTSLFLRTARCERWARIGALHDLGPLLNVEHGVATLHRVLDLQAFCHIVQFVTTSQEATCAIALRFDNFQSTIEIKTSCSTAFTLIDGECLEKQVEGSAQTLELAAFGEFASEVGKEAKLYVGFGLDDLAMLKLEWEPVSSKKSVAYLYFCTN